MNSNIKESIVRLDRPVPRYTSYPTAPHFKSGFGHNEHKNWLEMIPTGATLSLYFHIPFCPKLCWFCGCNTKITKRYAPVEDYLGLLLREIEIVGKVCADTRLVKHIHFGGGSPTMIKAADFSLLMSHIRRSFNVTADAEIAIEIDPRQMSEAKVAAYAMAGVTRASLGIQDFNAKVLESVNRAQPFYASFESIKLLNDYGIKNINIDLMYGLPHQTPETMKESAMRALLLHPDRIALFGYAHVPWMKKHMRLIPEQALPDATTRLDLFEVAADSFRSAGYVPIGIDHFAKPEDPLTQATIEGKLHRNFQGYTNDRTDALIGMGVSAISRLQQGFIQNSLQMPAYREAVSQSHLPAEKFFPVSNEDKLREQIIQSLMCQFSADTGDICESNGYDRNYFKNEINSLKSLRDSGLIECSDTGSIHILTPQAARLACAAFDAYLQPSETPKHITST